MKYPRSLLVSVAVEYLLGRVVSEVYAAFVSLLIEEAFLHDETLLSKATTDWAKVIATQIKSLLVAIGNNGGSLRENARQRRRS